MSNISVQAAFNSLPHISNVKKAMELQPDPAMKSEQFTFMLPHRHFFLAEGELLWVEPKGPDYKTKVIEGKQLLKDALPCMWLYLNGWVPYAYTCKELGYSSKPKVPYTGKYFIGVRWLNNGGAERTNVEERTMMMDTMEQSSKGIRTMCNWNIDDSQRSRCFGSICYGGQHCDPD